MKQTLPERKDARRNKHEEFVHWTVNSGDEDAEAFKTLKGCELTLDKKSLKRFVKSEEIDLSFEVVCGSGRS